ncbi:alpha-amylase [Tersicoccus solisilvae]|uniref:Alpha-amylase n=1 Tax=Tersicoccus solisilvae TaxID=1882339 RepID=A0ABQ1P6X5_9MICC|nr:alpha-amylase family glycosyl hydrolase [Tersicoccus solisilvae]GGC90070.1 alpha-amylase [Tersicoccus solisilvae]
MGWIDHAIWWHVYPLGFTGAEHTLREAGGTVRHRLADLTSWLDYLVELGCNGLALGPIFLSASHGYDTIDHYTVDPRLGDDADFDRLVDQAHARGIKVLLDGVFNHVGRDFSMLQRAEANGPESDAAAWFRWHDVDGRREPETFEGHEGLVALNHEHPAVVDYVSDVMTHWLDRGVDGWRLDAAYAVPAEFWARALAAPRQAHPEFWAVGEMIHGEYADYVDASGLDSVTQYELWKAIWSSINDVNFFELDHALGRHAQFCRRFLPLTFLGNHDVTRLASRIERPEHRDHAQALLFFLPGVPSIYYGDEQSFAGVKEERLGGDDEIRPPFPRDGDALHGWDTYHRVQELISVRRRHPGLQTAEIEVVAVENAWLELGATVDGARLRLGLNLADEPRTVPTGQVLAASDGSRTPGTIAAHGWQVAALGPGSAAD